MGDDTSAVMNGETRMSVYFSRCVKRKTTENFRREPLRQSCMSACTLAVIIKPSTSFIDIVVESILCQSDSPSEVLFVADGAPADTVREIERLCPTLPVTARVVWTHDHRSSNSRERNALRAAVHAGTANYIIVSDSSVILHRRFVEMHTSLRLDSTIQTGSRTNLSAHLSENITEVDIRKGWPSGHYLELFMDGIFGDSSMLSHAPLVTAPAFRRLLSRGAADVHGGNFSLHRVDAERVLNFLDSTEQPDAGSLLASCGIRIRYERNAFIQYECQESSSFTLLRQPGLLRRVQQLHVAVRDVGLRPAMHSRSAHNS